MRRLGRVLVSIPLLLLAAWWALALLYAGPAPHVVNQALAAAVVLATIGLLVMVRPFRRAVLVVVTGCLLLAAWWSTIRPRNDKDWAPELARIPHGELHGDLLTLHNLRNFDYRSVTDFTERWEDRTYDLSKLRGLDLFMSYWGSPNIAHTILSWEFDGGPPLAISIETRKTKTQEYSAIAGFFKQYTLYYVAADERDVVRVRTNYRGDEEVYLYPLAVGIPRARALLLDYLAGMNDLVEHPQFYEALLGNCTTTIRNHVRNVNPNARWDWRVFVNGYADQMLYEQGLVNTTLPFAELKRRSFINAAAQAADQDPAFSQRIRDGLPPQPPL